MASATPDNNITVTAVVTPNLDTTCYRGSAPAWQLARISEADVFDQVTNPEGLQRDLNKRHAAEAYAYVAAKPDPDRLRAFPEVILNVRDRSVVKIKQGDGQAEITFDLDKLDKARTTKVSRVDGNHRLMFLAGDGKDRGPIELPVPFQIHVGLTREQETELFQVLNSEQKGLNTSHLETLRSRLTPEDVELDQHPARAYARRLADDPTSPWHNLVHLGGSKAGMKEAGEYRPINFVALENGMRRILRKSQYLRDITDPDAKYGLLRNYWQAVRAVFPEAWAQPREFLILKNLGVNVFSELAATVIDRCLVVGNVESGHMVAMLEAVRERFDWHKNNPELAGMSGNRAVLLITGELTQALPKKAEAFRDPVDVYEEHMAEFATTAA